jgi:plastocyanin
MWTSDPRTCMVAVLTPVLIVVSIVALTLGCPPAFAANQTVRATSSSTFVEKDVTIAPGETVTWNNEGGTHNVHFDDNSFVMPMLPSPSSWSVARTFGPAAGTYRYYCDIHGGSGGMGMSGTVTVSASGGPAPTVPPGGGGQSPTPGDAKPTTSITAPSRQDVDKLYVKASMNEAGMLTATGRVNVPGGSVKVYRFKPLSRTAQPNVVVKLRLKLSGKSLRTVRRSLRRKRLRAKVTVTARDSAGNQTAQTRRIRLTR